uniref:Homeobox domain-containing protein n=1 Tax=Triticum urartu TaxID=4572 RepID=A0A8R7QKD8_TRIUA
MDLSDNQIQILERAFKLCPYPSETQHADLGRELGVQPHQIEFWFKNRRAQMSRCLGLTAWQARDEQVDNHLSDSENDKIDSENDKIH